MSSLLLGKSLEKEWGDVIRKEQETEGLVELIARFIFDGEAGRFHRKVAIGAVDKTKQIAL